MEKRRVKLLIKQNDLLENIDKVIFDGIGSVRLSDDLEIYYAEDDGSKVRLRINPNEGFLMRKGEALIQINFNLYKQEQCKVSTTVGDLYMEVNTKNIKVEKDKLFLYYELSENDEIIGKFELRLEWEDE